MFQKTVSHLGRRRVSRTTSVAARTSFFSQDRYFSDRLLGHSPMAPSMPLPGQEESKIPTARDVEIAGGIWNPSSAKRDKIAELKVELLPDQYTLDDAATDQQMRDLNLADGVQWIAYTTDSCRLGQPGEQASDVPLIRPNGNWSQLFPTSFPGLKQKKSKFTLLYPMGC